MVIIRLKIRSKRYRYDDFVVNEDNLKKFIECNKRNNPGGDTGVNCYPIVVCCDGVLVHYIVQELKISPKYRKGLIERMSRNHTNKIRFELVPPTIQIIDYAWNERTNHMAWERLELDHALSWLSTLGGAFSALGDYFTNAALMAGKISLHQFKLAMRLNDPNVQARCRLFMSLSLIQQGRLRLAKTIISYEYHKARTATVVDQRLVKMCLGIWAKLKYEWYKKIHLCDKFNKLSI